MTPRFPCRAGAVPEYLTAAEVAALFGVQRGAVTRWANDGMVKSGRTPGGHRRFPSAQFSEAIAALADTEHAA